MTRRYRNARGDMIVMQGRTQTMPFGRIGDWPERHEDLSAMQAAESAANEQRSAYRAWERRQPCDGCRQPGPGHAPGCIWH